ncbi:hypothetical protein ES703_109308 [subsurface metagenome]
MKERTLLNLVEDEECGLLIQLLPDEKEEAGVRIRASRKVLKVLNALLVEIAMLPITVNRGEDIKVVHNAILEHLKLK